MKSAALVWHRHPAGENTCLRPVPHIRQQAPAPGSFSLVELIIVIVILGIIAAIAVPRMSSAAAQTNETALVSNLKELRKAIEMYAAEHGGEYPGKNPDSMGGAANTEAALLNQLTRYTDTVGNASIARSAQFRFGPYLRSMPGVPVGPNKGSQTVAIDTVNTPPLATGGAEGWVYNPSTGAIIANTDAANIAGTRAYDEY